MKESIHDIFKNSYGKYGVPAFNVFNAQQVWGVFKGASRAGKPVIIAITPMAINYLSLEVLSGIITAVSKLFPSVKYSVHLDHGDEKSCLMAIEYEVFDSIMIDASHESFEENIRITKSIVEKAHSKNILVEAELGVLSGVEDHLNILDSDSKFTNPKDVVGFVSSTKCDSLAVAIGTSHGAYKQTSSEGLQLKRLKEIQKLLPKFPIVLHGASNVSKDEIKRINKSGGKIKSNAKGIELEEIREAIKLGVTKINIATDLRLLWARINREFFIKHPELFDPVIPGKEYIEELSNFVENKCKSLMI